MGPLEWSEVTSLVPTVPRERSALHAIKLSLELQKLVLLQEFYLFLTFWSVRSRRSPFRLFASDLDYSHLVKYQDGARQGYSRSDQPPVNPEPSNQAREALRVRPHANVDSAND